MLHRGRRPRHPMARVVLPAIPAGAVIGYCDVRVWEHAWPTIICLMGAAFLITWLSPSRWLSAATTLAIMMWLALAWVRVPFWDHPDEVGRWEAAPLLVAVVPLAGAMLAALIQLKRGRF